LIIDPEDPTLSEVVERWYRVCFRRDKPRREDLANLISRRVVPLRPLRESLHVSLMTIENSGNPYPESPSFQQESGYWTGVNMTQSCSLGI